MAEKFEQHLQTGVGTIAIAVMMWVGVTLNQLQQNHAALTVEITHVKTNLGEIKAGLDGAYPTVNAARDREIVRELQERVRRLEMSRTVHL